MKKDESNENLSWKELQDGLADENGLAIVLVDKDSVDILKSNNNSICEILYNSEEFAPKCAEFCGKAYEKATRTDKNLSYRCHAGLSCLAIPIKNDVETVVAIVGRAFLSSEEYRRATNRASDEDWSEFSPRSLFENALLSGSPRYLKRVTKRLKTLTTEERLLISEFLGKKIKPQNLISSKQAEEVLENEGSKQDLTKLIEQFHKKDPEEKLAKYLIEDIEIEQSPELMAWRSHFSSLLKLNYRQACLSILNFINEKFGVKSLAWAENIEDHFELVLGIGKFEFQKIQLKLSATDEKLVAALESRSSLELREKKNGKASNSPLQAIRLFPLSIGKDIRSALVLGDEISDEETLDQIWSFCGTIANELEILRLREELTRSGWLENAVRVFNDNVKNIDSDDFWLSLTQITAELMNAERSSLLVSDDDEKSLIIKAATGIKSDLLKSSMNKIGHRIAKDVLEFGKPVVIENIDDSDFESASIDWKYKTPSFISFPIMIGERRLGVLNITDKADGGNYNDLDLNLLKAIMPQLAVLVDRATLKHKAGEYEQLSITDALTGLLNRRYLEERITEEITRSNRHNYQMSFMMIDVDDFKSYNEAFMHPEGDKALKIVGQCIKDSLRGADVAARYGGEEFSILLPQTNSGEAKFIAERIRQKIERANFSHRQVTVSIGVASSSSVVNTAEGLISAADLALFQAKSNGKNIVQVYENLKVS